MSSKNKLFRIILADDHPMFRDGLVNFIHKVKNFKAVADVGDGDGLLNALDRHKCDLVILDLSMPELSGLEALTQIKKKFPKLKIMILTMHKEREFFRAALAAGVQGYILKNEPVERIISAIKDIQRGRESFSEELVSFVVGDYKVILDSHISLNILTKRQREIVALIAEGKTSKEIGAQLKITKRTVDGHRANIMKKLQLRSVAELIRFAISEGIV